MFIVSLLYLVLRIAAVVFGVVSLVHVVRQRADAYPAVGKMTKPIWIGITAASTIVFLILPPLSLLWIVGIVAVGVYMADVRPKVDEIQQPKSW